MTSKKPDKISPLIEEISLDTVMLDAENPESLRGLVGKLKQLKTFGIALEISEKLDKCLSHFKMLLSGGNDPLLINQSLLEISNLISEIKTDVTNTPGKKNFRKSETRPGLENPAVDAKWESVFVPVDIAAHGEVSLIKDFIAETKEHLEESAGVLLALESNSGRRDAINEIFRMYHTVKGTASYLELKPFQVLAHETENLLGTAREGVIELKGKYLEAVFAANEAMEEEIQRLIMAMNRKESYVSSDNLPSLVNHIRRLNHSCGQEADIYCKNSIYSPPKSPEESVKNPQFKNQINETIKVDTSKLDKLLDIIGELVISESIVTNDPEITTKASVRLRKNLHQLNKITRNLQEIGTSIRMVSMKSSFQKMSVVARNIVKTSGKKIKLAYSGEDTELDKSIIEHMADPLIHLIRNCADHGIETPEQRVEAGKPEEGTIYLRAFQKSGGICIEIEDDGKGLDKQAILSKGREQGILPKEVLPSDTDIFNAILAPGFSTVEKVSDLSGRGVGMDVVKRNIEKLRGNIEIKTREGKGTTFSMLLPLTLAIIDGMVVKCAEDRYIIPTLSVIESFKPKQGDFTRFIGQANLIEFRGEQIPVLRLSEIFELPAYSHELSEELVVVVEGLNRKIGLIVDRLEGKQQIVIKNLGNLIQRIEGVSGGAIMQDGSVSLILDIPSIITSTLDQKPGVQLLHTA